MAMASMIMLIPAWPRIAPAIRLLNRREILLLCFSGIALGLHFAAWITSLFHTTIANSAVIVATQPVWVLILEIIFLKIRMNIKSVIGTATAFIGIIIISGSDFSTEREFLTGDMLSLAGALFVAVYIIIGRRLRQKMDNIVYTFMVYSIAAVTILIMALGNGENLTDYQAKTWIFFLLLALVPTLMGHSLYNWLLKYFQAHRVAITVLGEPIGAAILAVFFFSEIPGWWTIVGGVFILSGIFIVLKRVAE
jgi:drug/metabolite transporter (DMT)-like permease